MMKRSGFTFTEKMSVMANSLVRLNVNSDDPCKTKLEYSSYFWKFSRIMTEYITRNF